MIIRAGNMHRGGSYPPPAPNLEVGTHYKRDKIMCSLAKFNPINMTWDVLMTCTKEKAHEWLTYFRHNMPSVNIQIIV